MEVESMAEDFLSGGLSEEPRVVSSVLASGCL